MFQEFRSFIPLPVYDLTSNFKLFLFTDGKDVKAVVLSFKLKNQIILLDKSSNSLEKHPSYTLNDSGKGSDHNSTTFFQLELVKIAWTPLPQPLS